MPDGTLFKVYQSGAIKNNINPTWPPAEEPLQRLCGADQRGPVVVQVFDWNKSGKHELIGEATVSIEDICRSLTPDRPSHMTVNLVHPAKAEKAKTKGKPVPSSGELVVLSASVIRRPSFLEFLRGGDVTMSMLGAVDFTGSNGDPRSPTSLHYINPVAPNEYLTALQAVGNILLDYDKDKQVPLYGFGGSIMNGPVNHCFALNFNEQQPAVSGLEGIVGAYKNAFQYVGLSGPTYFAPVIQRAAQLASMQSGPCIKYHLLLIITDGQMNDADATVEAIVSAAHLPLSIVIVGVGAADFSAMVMLDGDDRRLSYNGRVAPRDIVQFCPYRSLAVAGTGTGSLLAREVLKEIPGQVTEYFRLFNRLPTPPPSASEVAHPPMIRSPTIAYPPLGVGGGSGGSVPLGVGAVAVPLP